MGDAKGRRSDALPSRPTAPGDQDQATGTLPSPLTSFVGRAWELAELGDLLRRSRLLTLTGAGGCGKTRLAVEVASRESAEFRDGVWWVPFASISDAALTASALAHVLGVRPLPGQSELEAVVAYLAPRCALLLLDNCEHILDEAARIAEGLTRGCPHVRVLATSREPLRADGETEWRVPSLALPPPDSVDSLMAQPTDAPDAVQLFVARAAQVRPGFHLTKQRAPAVATICRELDGIPLAIELAAARLRAFSVEQVAEGLADRFRLLAGGLRTALPRHQTLRASVQWSHDLLDERERATFRRLGVFAGGFTLAAAEDVCAGDGIETEQILALVIGLVEKSLVQADECDGGVRYRLLETMRQYALERLEERDELDAVRNRHRDHYLELAERIEPELFTPRQAEALDVLDPEKANFSLAIERAAATDPDKALRLTVALTLWWRLRSMFAQGDAGFARALEAAREPSMLHARALWGRAFLQTFAGALETALPAAERALAMAEAVGDRSTAALSMWLIGVSMMWPDPVGSRPVLERARELAAESGDAFALLHTTEALGMTYTFQDDDPRGRRFHDEAMRLGERLGQQDTIAFHLLGLGLAAYVAGDPQGIEEAAQASLAVAHRAGDIVTEAGGYMGLALAAIETGRPTPLRELEAVRARALAGGGALILPAIDWTIGLVHSAAGRLPEAQSVFEMVIGQGASGWANMLTRVHLGLAEVLRLLDSAARAQAAAVDALTLATRIDDRPLAAEAQLVLGWLAAARGEWAEAQRLAHQSLTVAAERGLPRVPRVLETLAGLAAGLGRHTEAARILGAADRGWRERGAVAWFHQRTEAEELEDRLRAVLSEEVFERAYAEGQALSTDDAVGYVRRMRGERKRPAAGWESLTPTEVEVARHAAAGRTNPEIAERMFISRGTVRTHLSHIFAKLGVRNRSELAAQAIRRGFQV